MTTQRVAALFRDVAAGLHAAPDQPASCFRWLAERLLDPPRVAAAHLVAALIEPAERPGGAATRVISAAGGDAPAPDSAAFRAFGPAFAIGDLRPVTLSWFAEGDVVAGVPIPAGAAGLLIRVRLEYAIVWTLLIGEPAQLEDERAQEHAAMLESVLPGLTAHLNPRDPEVIRRAFLSALVSYAPVRPDADFEHVCRVWRAATGADFCWLWLHNELTGNFELTACSTSRSGSRPLPPQRQSPGEGSAGRYTSLSGRPVRIDDVRAWSADWEGKRYRVLMADALVQMGCPALLCVPIPAPGGGGGRSNLITLHARSPAAFIRHSDQTLMTKGRATGMSIELINQIEQTSILVELNRLAQRFLSQPTGRPAHLRAQYLKALIELIRNRLRVSCVSVFQRVGPEPEVRCIGTSGLTDVKTGRAIAEDRLATARYQSGERNTGTCFQMARPIIKTHDVDVKYRETRKRDGSAGENPALYVPIPDPLNEYDDGRAAGVIRCFDHVSPMFPDTLSNFDGTEVENLIFIAEQVGPVLRTFENRLQRERTISVLKHDLYAPLSMMRDTIECLLQEQGENKPLNPFHLRDLQVSNRVTSSLVEQLDPDPGAVREVNAVPTYLEGEIVARLCDMMGHLAWGQKRIRIRYDGFRDIPRLRIDPVLVERAIYNLITNAIKYAAPSTLIEVLGQALPDGTGYVVHVTNEGIGIDAADRPHLFRAGFRSRRAAQVAMGAGLGLSIAQAAMQAVGGEIRVTRLNNPTTFTLYFPAHLSATG